jgi:hypothetical protein
MELKTNVLCDLRGADIALFPLFDKNGIEYKKFISKEVSEWDIIGVASLPPFFLNRLNFYDENGKTYFKDKGKEVPVVISSINYEQLEKTTVSEFWNQCMMVAHKGVRPRIWILAPDDVCKYIISQYIGEETAGFYLHNEDTEINLYYAIEKIGSTIKAHKMF